MVYYNAIRYIMSVPINKPLLHKNTIQRGQSLDGVRMENPVREFSKKYYRHIVPMCQILEGKK